MLLVFQMVFPAPVMSWNETIGDEQAGGGGGRWQWVGSQRWVKATIQTQRAVLCLQCETQTDTIDKGGQDWHEEQFGTPCSPINALQNHEIYPRDFAASIRSRL